MLSLSIDSTGSLEQARSSQASSQHLTFGRPSKPPKSRSDVSYRLALRISTLGSRSRLKRRERSCRRWQLEFCCWIYEESRPLGMHPAIS